jgi:hypothetical protein
MIRRVPIGDGIDLPWPPTLGLTLVSMQVAPRSSEEKAIATMPGLHRSGLPGREYVPKYGDNLFHFQLARAFYDALSVHVSLSGVSHA